MLVAKIKRFLGFGLLLALALGISTNHLWTAEAIINHNQSLLDTAEAGELDLVVRALNDGADINFRDAKSDETALTSAVRNGYTEMVHLLLDRGANPNIQGPRGATAVILAARDGRLGEARLLLAYGADMNMQNQFGYSALAFAAERGHLEVARLLLANGANVNLQAQDGWTVLMVAAQEWNLEIVRLLLAAGANVDLQNQTGITALLLAARNGQLEIVRLLLAAGANVNLQRPDGGTALMFAALRERPEIIRLLLGAGAELPAADRLTVEQNARIQAALAELAARKAEFLAAAATGNLAQINRLIALPIRDRKLVMNQALLALAVSETDIPAADFERILAILLAHGADIEFRDTVETGGFREAKDAAAASVSAASDTALELAIMTNVPNRVDALLMAGANPEKLSESIKIYLANASLAANLAIKEIAKMIENANMARAMLISPAIFKRFTLNIGLDQDNTLDPVLRYLFQWEEQENDRAKRAGRAKMLATPLPPDED